MLLLCLIKWQTSRYLVYLFIIDSQNQINELLIVLLNEFLMRVGLAINAESNGMQEERYGSRSFSAMDGGRNGRCADSSLCLLTSSPANHVPQHLLSLTKYRKSHTNIIVIINFYFYFQ